MEGEPIAIKRFGDREPTRRPSSVPRHGISTHRQHRIFVGVPDDGQVVYSGQVDVQFRCRALYMVDQRGGRPLWHISMTSK